VSGVERALGRLLAAHRLDRLDRAGPGMWIAACACRDRREGWMGTAGTAREVVAAWAAHLEQAARVEDAR